MQRVTERGSRLSQKLVFLDLELAGVPDEAAAAWLADPAVARWRHWLEVVRMYRPHLLTEPEEKIMTEKSVTGRNAWTRFFDEVHAAARYQYGGRASRSRCLRSLHARPGAPPGRRLGYGGAAGALRTTTFIFNNILADKSPMTGCAAIRAGFRRATWPTRSTTHRGRPGRGRELTL